MAPFLRMVLALALVLGLVGCRSSDKPEEVSTATASAEAKDGAAKPAVAPKECGTVPPVSNCCGDDTDECRACRQEAMTKLLAWKEKCADAEPTCASQPMLSACCQALIPSCEACKERNRRLQDSWRRRCEKAN